MYKEEEKFSFSITHNSPASYKRAIRAGYNLEAVNSMIMQYGILLYAVILKQS